VLGITHSSQSDLLAQLDQLGTNLLTVVNGHTIAGDEAELPHSASAMIGRVDGVTHVAPTAQLDTQSVFRTDKIPAFQTNGLAVRACDASLPSTLGAHVHQGTFLSQATASFPTTVLGHQAATALGIDHLDPAQPTRIGIGGHWFTVVGILDPLQLAPEIDRSALVGFPVAEHLLGYDGHPSRIYVRAVTDQTVAVAALLAPSTDPDNPQQVDVSRPSDALTARLKVANASTGLFLGLGAVALLVGGIGIANVMVIGVLERRGEIGLRRALGATRAHVAAQFLVESLLLSALGGLLGVLLGISLTVGLSWQRHWTVLVPRVAVAGGLGTALAIGAVAGLYPAMRAARLSPTDALRTV
jgi:putative ABC transport system permease protein